MTRKTSRPNARGEESRQRILAATFELANELGYDGTSISMVSQRSGLPASSVYWHFENKDALFAEVIESSFERWLAGMPRWSVSASDADLGEVLAERMAANIRGMASNPEFWRLGLMLTLEHRVVDTSARGRFLAVRARMLEILERWWLRQLPGEADLSRDLARFTLAASDGLFVSMQAGDGWDYDRLAEMLAHALAAWVMSDHLKQSS